jgi:hypothetical protein
MSKDTQLWAALVKIELSAASFSSTRDSHTELVSEVMPRIRELIPARYQQNHQISLGMGKDVGD